MNTRFFVFPVAALAIIAAVAIVTHITTGRREVDAAKRQENLRQAKVARMEIDEQGRPIDASWECKTEFDSGAVAPLEHVSHAFTIRSTGKGPLRLKYRGADGEVQCNIPEILVLEPGKSLTVPVSFYAPEEEGVYSATLTFTTNDKAAEVLQLRIDGEVVRDVWWEPQGIVRFASIDPGVAVAKDVCIYSSKAETNLQDVTSSSSELTLTVTEIGETAQLPKTAKRGWVLRAEAAPTYEREVLCDARLTFDTAGTPSTKQMFFEIERTGAVQLRHDLLTLTGTLEIGNIPAGTAKEIPILVKIRGPEKRMELARVVCDPTFLEVTPQATNAEAGSYILKVAIPADAPVGSYTGRDEHATIRLEFKLPKEQVMEMNVHFTITPE